MFSLISEYELPSEVFIFNVFIKYFCTSSVKAFIQSCDLSDLNNKYNDN